MAYETTRVVVGLGDPVIWCLARTGRRDGGWVCSEFQMTEDLADHFERNLVHYPMYNE